MYHGIKYKGLRYKLFLSVGNEKSQLEGLPEEAQGNEKDWEMKVKIMVKIGRRITLTLFARS